MMTYDLKGSCIKKNDGVFKVKWNILGGNCSRKDHIYMNSLKERNEFYPFNNE